MGDVPRYAILSHTWGAKELTYAEFFDRTNWKGDGFDKIKATCREASNRGIRYAWADTCCIDKSSSSELSEAINSMFRWYEESEVCFAFLVDVVRQQDTPDASFEASRWFTRGWTLQELLAPRKLDFFDANWALLGSRRDLSSRISSITGISEAFLLENTVSSRHSLLQEASIAERISWAASRVTTREEDVAYCLLGILGVNMPLIYGEGANAFMRLQAEVISHCFEPSLLAWNAIRNGVPLPPEKSPKYSRWRSAFRMITWAEHPWSSAVAVPTEQTEWFQSGISPLASSPSYFLHPEDIGVGDVAINWSATSHGLEITLPISQNKSPYLLLPCYLSGDPTSLFAIPLLEQNDGTYLRACAPTRLVSRNKWHQWERKTVVLKTKRAMSSVHYDSRVQKYDIFIRSIPSGLRMTKSYVDGILTPHSKSKRAMNDPTLLLRSTNGAIAMLFDVEGSNTPITLGIRQVSVEPTSLLLGNHGKMRLSCSFETADPLESIASTQPGSAPRAAQEYLRLGSGILYTRIMKENTVDQRVFVIDIIFCTGTIHQLLLRIWYDTKAWSQRQAAGILRQFQNIGNAEGTTQPIGAFSKPATVILELIKSTMELAGTFAGVTVVTLISWAAGVWLGINLCFKMPEWVDFVGQTALLTGSLLAIVSGVVSLSILAVQLLPIVCCFWPQTSYFLRKHIWFLAAAIGIGTSTLTSHIELIRFIPLLWAMGWWYGTCNGWTGSRSFILLLLFDLVIIMVRIVMDLSFFGIHVICNVPKEQPWAPDALLPRTHFEELSWLLSMGFSLIAGSLWLFFKYWLRLVESGLFEPQALLELAL